MQMGRVKRIWYLLPICYDGILEDTNSLDAPQMWKYGTCYDMCYLHEYVIGMLMLLLQAYISSLTQKTSQQKKSVNFEDLGESISISSDIEDAPLHAKTPPAPSSGSKFLKKKTAVSDEAESSPGGEGASKFLKTTGQLGDVADLGASGNKFLKKPQTAAAGPSPAVTAQTR